MNKPDPTDHVPDDDIHKLRVYLVEEAISSIKPGDSVQFGWGRILRPSHSDSAITYSEGNSHLRFRGAQELADHLAAEGSLLSNPMHYQHLHEELRFCETVGYAQHLIEIGADPSFRGVLHGVRNPEVAQLLIDHGADPTAVDARGDTPLHDAYSADTVLVLLGAGADPLAKNHQGLTPLDKRRKELEEGFYDRDQHQIDLIASLEAATSQADLNRELASFMPPKATDTQENEVPRAKRRTRRM